MSVIGMLQQASSEARQATAVNANGFQIRVELRPGILRSARTLCAGETFPQHQRFSVFKENLRLHCALYVPTSLSCCSQLRSPRSNPQSLALTEATLRPRRSIRP